jgi:hypothetical protein
MNFKSCHLPANRRRAPDYDCKEVMDEVYSSRPDLMDTPLSDPELEFFMGKSSFVQGGW